jgi:hypothetical protein
MVRPHHGSAALPHDSGVPEQVIRGTLGRQIGSTKERLLSVLENLRGALPLMFALGLLFVAGDELTRRGRLYDAMTGQPLKNAIVTLGDAVARTEANGSFQIRGTGLIGREGLWIPRRVDLAQQKMGHRRLV